VIGLEGGEPHHNGTHWGSLLIERKDRVPNRSVRTIQRLRCRLGRFDLDGQLAPDAEPGRLQLASSPRLRSAGAELG
jgi:hypothetical protein